jgi:hypothetical protein
MTPGSGEAADPSARCCRARPIIGHRQDQVQASLSDYADERTDHPYMRAGASSALVEKLAPDRRHACASWIHPGIRDQGSIVRVTLRCRIVHNHARHTKR